MPRTAPWLEMTTMRPRPAARIDGKRARVSAIGPNRLVAKIWSHALAGVSSNIPAAAMPALCTRTSGAPTASSIALAAAAMYAVFPFLHVSIRTGMMGYMFPVYALPVVALALVAWAVVLRGRTAAVRRVTLATAIVLAVGAWTMVRTGGFKAAIDHDFALRWTPTAEERLLARGSDEPPPVAAPVAATPSAAMANVRRVHGRTPPARLTHAGDHVAASRCRAAVRSRADRCTGAAKTARRKCLRMFTVAFRS